MPKLSNVQKKFLAEATTKYKDALPGSLAEEFLEKRGLDQDETVKRFRLGYVADPLPGHEMYKGWLAIPYIRQAPGERWSVVSMRFRCLEEHDHMGHGKYMSNPGDTPRMFNTMALIQSEDTVAICEGELDSITATMCGIPAVGIPGVKSWKEHFKEPFLGYETVYILADGDRAGMDFAHDVAKKLPNTKILPSSHGGDVNSDYLDKGKEALLERVG